MCSLKLQSALFNKETDDDDDVDVEVKPLRIAATAASQPMS